MRKNNKKRHKMKQNITIWIIIILLLIVGWLLLGPPTEIGIPGGVIWTLNKDIPKDIEINKRTNNLPQKVIYASEMIKISEIKSRREVYSVGENATMDIKIENLLSVPYTLSVYWINNNQRKLGWNITNDINNSWQSWYPINKPGTWKINVVVNWSYNGVDYDADKNINIEVY